MQTFSNMRRNSSYNRYLKLFVLALALLLYQIFSSVYIFLSPLAGFFFIYIVKNFKRDNLEVYLAFLYLCFFELNQGFYLFSTVLLFAIFYTFLKSRIEAVFENRLWIIVITVASAYLGMFFINTFLAYLFNHEFFNFGIAYFFYIIVDTILSALLLKYEK
ncbi:MAG: hypothetical protein LBP54_07070 [Campylobacteraceae bacterium]|jgi:hypothetical protein|nr:hypothetical protein [Campylobacteraceae bacterium]